MSKKLPWPVAKMREDGTPAIWLTFTNWLVVKTGIVGAYLMERSSFGERRARQEARQRFGPEWRKCAHLESMAMVDAWHPLFSNESAALELYRVGWNAYCATHEKSRGNTMSLERLVALGDTHERRGFEAEVKRLQEKAEALAADASPQEAFEFAEPTPCAQRTEFPEQAARDRGGKGRGELADSLECRFAVRGKQQATGDSAAPAAVTGGVPGYSGADGGAAAAAGA